MTRQEARRWIADAVKDGWTWKMEQQAGTDHFDLSKNGYRVLAWIRSPAEEASLSVWGPDRLAVQPPTAYDWNVLVTKTRECCYCHKLGPTVRIGFAGRCCPECKIIHIMDVERPGWCD